MRIHSFKVAIINELSSGFYRVEALIIGIGIWGYILKNIGITRMKANIGNPFGFHSTIVKPGT